MKFKRPQRLKKFSASDVILVDGKFPLEISEILPQLAGPHGAVFPHARNEIQINYFRHDQLACPRSLQNTALGINENRAADTTDAQAVDIEKIELV